MSQASPDTGCLLFCFVIPLKQPFQDVCLFQGCCAFSLILWKWGEKKKNPTVALATLFKLLQGKVKHIPVNSETSGWDGYESFTSESILLLSAVISSLKISESVPLAAVCNHVTMIHREGENVLFIFFFPSLFLW